MTVISSLVHPCIELYCAGHSEVLRQNEVIMWDHAISGDAIVLIAVVPYLCTELFCFQPTENQLQPCTEIENEFQYGTRH